MARRDGADGMRRIVGRTLHHDDFVVAECLFIDAAAARRQCGRAVTRCDDNAEAWSNGPPRSTCVVGCIVPCPDSCLRAICTRIVCLPPITWAVNAVHLLPLIEAHWVSANSSASQQPRGAVQGRERGGCQAAPRAALRSVVAPAAVGMSYLRLSAHSGTRQTAPPKCRSSPGSAGLRSASPMRTKSDGLMMPGGAVVRRARSCGTLLGGVAEYGDDTRDRPIHCCRPRPH